MACWNTCEAIAAERLADTEPRDDADLKTIEKVAAVELLFSLLYNLILINVNYK